MFSVTLKQKASVFKLLPFDWCFQKALFCWQISTDSRPDHKKRTLFSFFSTVVSKVGLTKEIAVKSYFECSTTNFAVKSGALAAWRAAKRSVHNYRNRTTCMHGNRNPRNSFLMVKMAITAWITGACAQRRRMTTSHNMVTIQLIPSHAVLDYSIYLWY